MPDPVAWGRTEVGGPDHQPHGVRVGACGPRCGRPFLSGQPVRPRAQAASASTAFFPPMRRASIAPPIGTWVLRSRRGTGASDVVLEVGCAGSVYSGASKPTVKTAGDDCCSADQEPSDTGAAVTFDRYHTTELTSALPGVPEAERATARPGRAGSEHAEPDENTSHTPPDRWVKMA
jgi:hypothetical protein